MKFPKIIFFIYFFTMTFSMILGPSYHKKNLNKSKKPRKLQKLTNGELLAADVTMEKYVPLSLAFIGKYQVGLYGSKSNDHKLKKK